MSDSHCREYPVGDLVLLEYVPGTEKWVVAGRSSPWFEETWDPFGQSPENEIAGAYVHISDLVEALQNSLTMASCLDASGIRANVRCLQKAKGKLAGTLSWVEKTLDYLEMPEVSANG